MTEIANQLGTIQNRIAAACRRAGRDETAVKLVAVSKTFPAEAVSAAIEAGHTCFGESRLQEAEPKIQQLPGGLDWHFIGRVQRNKVRKILPLFSCIHAVDSLKLARYIGGVAADLALKPTIFLQVNQAGEASKGGFDEATLSTQIVEIAALSRLSIAGLMSIPPVAAQPEQSRQWFRELRQLRDRMEQEFSLSLPSLSMGMSGDFEIAAEEGATHIRVGSAIFGKRDYAVEGELG